MARTIILDANVIDQLNRGNEGAANSVREMRRAGDTLYVSQQAYNELAVNPMIPRTAAANRELLGELNIRIAPPGDVATRTQVYAGNQTANGVLLSEADVLVAAQARATNAEVWSFDRAYRNNGNAIRQRLGVRVAPESTSVPMVQGQADYRTARRLMGLPPLEIGLNGQVTRTAQAGRGPGVGPINSATPGMKSPEGTQTKMLGGIIALGVIVSWLDDYCIEKSMKKDVEEWEQYIRNRQNLDPENGFLLVAIIKKWQPRDAAYATRSYVSMEMFEAYTLSGAESMARKNILPGLQPPTDTVSYSYVKMWIAPLKPKVFPTQEQSDEKAYGKESWYPRYKLVRQSLEPPPAYGEALSVLQASSMYDILRVLDALPTSQFNELKAKLTIVKEDINKARFGIAFAAVEERKSSSSFGSHSFLRNNRNAENFAMLKDDFSKNCIKDWVDSGTGTIQHQMQGRWEVILDGRKFEYSFRLSGKVTWRDMDKPGHIGGEGTWEVTQRGVRVQWPKSGTVETFDLPINENQQKARCVMKNGSFDMTAKKTNPYP